MQYTCHSGGCPGADMVWETEGEKYGVKTISYSFRNHIQESKNQKILTVEELEEGWYHAILAERTLRRDLNTLSSPYVRNLISRNWFQIKNAEAVFAVGKFVTRSIVDGGTGWAVQMAIDSDKPVYVFDQESNMWTRWMVLQFESIRGEILRLTTNFAGIGTRKINHFGKWAIQQIYKDNFIGPID